MSERTIWGTIARGIAYLVITIAIIVGAVVMDEAILKTHRIYPFCRRLGIAEPIDRALRAIFLPRRG
jgi:hypothetical protein